MGNNPHRNKNSQKKYEILISRISPLGIIIIAACAGIFVWLIDAILYYLVFYQGRGNFLDILILDIPAHELFIRLLILGIFLFFGIIISMHFSSRIKAEENLIRSEERYRHLAETTPDLILLVDLHGRIKYANSAWQNTTGFNCKSLIGNLITDYISIESKGQTISKDADPKIQFKKTFRYKTEIVDKSGETIPVEINSTPLFIAGTVNEILIVIHDISEQIRNENELVAAKEKAEESDRLKSAFLANMSHEIRTPMNGILGFSDLLKQPQLSSDERLQFVDIIEKSGKRMLNIINDLIDISKIEARQAEVINSEFNLNEQFDYLYAFFKPEAEKSGLQLSCNKGLPDDTSFIYTDKNKLIDILINLIKNAIKYTNKGYIDFGYIKKEKSINFYVKDTGIGIAKDRQKAIFERFVQADLSITQPYEGAGLGLAIAKGYVELLNGTIWLESEKNKGTIFYTSLPINTEC